MTKINCLVAARNWKPVNSVAGEIKYLESINFVALDSDKTGNSYISLLTDEEGNHDIKLTPSAAYWLGKVLQEKALHLAKKLAEQSLKNGVDKQ